MAGNLGSNKKQLESGSGFRDLLDPDSDFCLDPDLALMNMVPLTCPMRVCAADVEEATPHPGERLPLHRRGVSNVCRGQQGAH